MVTIRHDGGGVYPPSPIQRPTPPAGIGPRPVLGRWLLADYNAEWRHRGPADLAREAAAFWLLPLPMQAAAWPRLVALTNELAERLLAVTVADGGSGQEVA